MKQFWETKFKKGMSAFLAFVMVLGMFPMEVLADGTEDAAYEQSVTEQTTDSIVMPEDENTEKGERSDGDELAGEEPTSKTAMPEDGEDQRNGAVQNAVKAANAATNNDATITLTDMVVSQIGESVVAPSLTYEVTPGNEDYDGTPIPFTLPVPDGCTGDDQVAVWWHEEEPEDESDYELVGFYCVQNNSVTVTSSDLPAFFTVSKITNDVVNEYAELSVEKEEGKIFYYTADDLQRAVEDALEADVPLELLYDVEGAVNFSGELRVKLNGWYWAVKNRSNGTVSIEDNGQLKVSVVPSAAQVKKGEAFTAQVVLSGTNAAGEEVTDFHTAHLTLCFDPALLAVDGTLPTPWYYAAGEDEKVPDDGKTYISYYNDGLGEGTDFGTLHFRAKELPNLVGTTDTALSLTRTYVALDAAEDGSTIKPADRAKENAKVTILGSVKVTLDPNGGHVDGGTEVLFNYGETATLPTAGTVKKGGYRFVGWYANSDLSGDAVTTVTEENHGQTLYAKWEIDEGQWAARANKVTDETYANTKTVDNVKWYYFETLQGAIDAAAESGATVELLQNVTVSTWSSRSGVKNRTCCIDVSGKTLTITSRQDETDEDVEQYIIGLSSIVDDGYGMICVEGKADVTFTNVTINGNNLRTRLMRIFDDETTVTLGENTCLRNAREDHDGGAVYLQNESTLIVDGTVFKEIQCGGHVGNTYYEWGRTGTSNTLCGAVIRADAGTVKIKKAVMDGTNYFTTNDTPDAAHSVLVGSNGAASIVIEGGQYAGHVVSKSGNTTITGGEFAIDILNASKEDYKVPAGTKQNYLVDLTQCSVKNGTTAGYPYVVEKIPTAYNVTFDSNGGSTVGGVSVPYNEADTAEFAAPTKADCTFAGWQYQGEIITRSDIAAKRELQGEQFGLTAQWADAAASVSDGDSVTYYTTLQAAIDAAKSGNTVTLLGNATMIDEYTLSGKSITLTGKNLSTQAPPVYATLTAASGKRLFTVSSGAGLTLTNITLQGTTTEVTGDGGAIYVDSGASLTLDAGTTIQDFKQSGGSGGGGAIFSAGALTMKKDAVIKNCTAARDGGAIFMRKGSTFTMTGGEIFGNSTNASGGGIANEGSVLTISGGKIYNNTAAGSGTQKGGGIAAWQYNSPVPQVTISGTVEIYGNTANQCGGGVSIENGTITMTGGKIYNNTASGNGGGVCIRKGGIFEMTGGTIKNCSAKTKGGGVCVLKTDSTLIIGGEANITGNTVNSEPNNVYLPSGKNITLQSGFTGTIGVTAEGRNTFGAQFGTASGVEDKTYKDQITNDVDNKLYGMVENGSLKWTSDSVTVTFNINIENGFAPYWHSTQPENTTVTVYKADPNALSTVSAKYTNIGYKLEGWYKEPQCTNKVTDTSGLTDGETLYAHWVRDLTQVAWATSDGKTGTVYDTVTEYTYTSCAASPNTKTFKGSGVKYALGMAITKTTDSQVYLLQDGELNFPEKNYWEIRFSTANSSFTLDGGIYYAVVDATTGAVTRSTELAAKAAYDGFNTEARAADERQENRFIVDRTGVANGHNMESALSDLTLRNVIFTYHGTSALLNGFFQTSGAGEHRILIDNSKFSGFTSNYDATPMFLSRGTDTYTLKDCTITGNGVSNAGVFYVGPLTKFGTTKVVLDGNTVITGSQKYDSDSDIRNLFIADTGCLSITKDFTGEVGLYLPTSSDMIAAICTSNDRADQMIDDDAANGKLTSDQGYTLTAVGNTIRVSKKYTVKFDLNGGAAAQGGNYDDRTVLHGDPIENLPAAPTRSGYVFSGWKWASDSTGAADTRIGEFKPTSSVPVVGEDGKIYSTVTLTAQWLGRVASVSGTVDGGIAGVDEKGNPVTYFDNLKTALTKAPEDSTVTLLKDGHTLEGETTISANNVTLDLGKKRLNLLQNADTNGWGVLVVGAGVTFTAKNGVLDGAYKDTSLQTKNGQDAFFLNKDSTLNIGCDVIHVAHVTGQLNKNDNGGTLVNTKVNFIKNDANDDKSIYLEAAISSYTINGRANAGNNVVVTANTPLHFLKVYNGDRKVWCITDATFESDAVNSTFLVEPSNVNYTKGCYADSKAALKYVEGNKTQYDENGNGIIDSNEYFDAPFTIVKLESGLTNGIYRLSAAKLNEYTAEGYTAQPYKRTVNGKTYDYPDGAATTAAGNWYIIGEAGYTLTYDLDGGAWGTTSAPAKYDSKDQTNTTIPAPTKNGYLFTGWRYIGTDEQTGWYVNTSGTPTLEKGWLVNTPDTGKVTEAYIKAGVYNKAKEVTEIKLKATWALDPNGDWVARAKRADGNLNGQMAADGWAYFTSLDAAVSYANNNNNTTAAATTANTIVEVYKDCTTSGNAVTTSMTVRKKPETTDNPVITTNATLNSSVFSVSGAGVTVNIEELSFNGGGRSYAINGIFIQALGGATVNVSGTPANPDLKTPAVLAYMQNATNNAGSPQGGAIYVAPNSTVTTTDANITGMTISTFAGGYGGGAVYVGDNASFKAVRTTMYNNSGRRSGGAIIACANSDIWLEDSLLDYNYARYGTIYAFSGSKIRLYGTTKISSARGDRKYGGGNKAIYQVNGNTTSIYVHGDPVVIDNKNPANNAQNNIAYGGVGCLIVDGPIGQDAKISLALGAALAGPGKQFGIVDTNVNAYDIYPGAFICDSDSSLKSVARDGKLYWFGTPVARTATTDESGTTTYEYYDTLNGAVRDVADGGAVELLRDITLTEQVIADGITDGEGNVTEKRFTLTSASGEWTEPHVGTSGTATGTFTVTAPANNRVFTLENGADVTLENITLLGNGKVTSDGNDSSGGAVYISSGASFTMNNNAKIKDFTIEAKDHSRGGAIYNALGGTFVMNDGSTIEHCASIGTTPTISKPFNVGGAIFNAGTANLNAGTITGCYTDRLNKGWNGGGAIFNSGTLNLGTNGGTEGPTIENCAVVTGTVTNGDPRTATGTGTVNDSNVSGGAIWNHKDTTDETATVNMYAGTTITGCYGINANSGVFGSAIRNSYVNNNDGAIFNMFGGTIQECWVKCPNRSFGAVSVEYKSVFNMSGGQIINNSGTHTEAAPVNSALQVGGVHLANNATMNLSGAATITGNTGASGNNIYINSTTAALNLAGDYTGMVGVSFSDTTKNAVNAQFGNVLNSAKITDQAIADETKTHAITNDTNEHLYGKVDEENRTLVWAGAPVTVTFHANGNGAAFDDEATTKEVGTTYGETFADAITSAGTPTRAGYSFAGWYRETGCTNQVNDTDTVNGAVTLYAKWQENAYMVSGATTELTGGIAGTATVDGVATNVTYFDSFAAALGAVNAYSGNDLTITQLKETVTLNITGRYSSSKSFTLDLGGHTLQSSYFPIISMSGTAGNDDRVVIKNGTVECTNDSNQNAAFDYTGTAGDEDSLTYEKLTLKTAYGAAMCVVNATGNITENSEINVKTFVSSTGGGKVIIDGNSKINFVVGGGWLSSTKGFDKATVTIQDSYFTSSQVQRTKTDPTKVDIRNYIDQRYMWIQLESPMPGSTTETGYSYHVVKATRVKLDAEGGTFHETGLYKDTSGYYCFEENTSLDLPVATRDGYKFDGWFDNNNSKVETATDAHKDAELVAKWTIDESYWAARVNNADGTNNDGAWSYYTTLQAAIDVISVTDNKGNAANMAEAQGNIIEVLKDYTAPETNEVVMVTKGQRFTLRSATNKGGQPVAGAPFTIQGLADNCKVLQVDRWTKNTYGYVILENVTFVGNGKKDPVPDGGPLLQAWNTSTVTLGEGVTLKGSNTGTIGGGAVWIGNGATVNMLKGATITDCTSTANGGGVINAGTFNMSGGTITGCSAVNGGAVYSTGKVTLSGNATITGNTDSTDATKAKNLYMTDGTKLTVENTTEKPWTGTLGVSNPREVNNQFGSGTLSADQLKKITNDVNSEALYAAQDGTALKWLAYEAMIVRNGDIIKYKKLADAVEGAKDSEIIYLLTNTTDTNVTVSKNVTITNEDGNKFAINGTLTASGSGKMLTISGVTVNGTLEIKNSGTLTLDGAAVKGTGSGDGVTVTNGTLSVKNGTVIQGFAHGVDLKDANAKLTVDNTAATNPGLIYMGNKDAKIVLTDGCKNLTNKLRVELKKDMIPTDDTQRTAFLNSFVLATSDQEDSFEDNQISLKIGVTDYNYIAYAKNGKTVALMKPDKYVALIQNNDKEWKGCYSIQAAVDAVTDSEAKTVYLVGHSFSDVVTLDLSNKDITFSGASYTETSGTLGVTTDAQVRLVADESYRGELFQITGGTLKLDKYVVVGDDNNNYIPQIRLDGASKVELASDVASGGYNGLAVGIAKDHAFGTVYSGTTSAVCVKIAAGADGGYVDLPYYAIKDDGTFVCREMNGGELVGYDLKVEQTALKGTAVTDRVTVTGTTSKTGEDVSGFTLAYKENGSDVCEISVDGVTMQIEYPLVGFDTANETFTSGGTFQYLDNNTTKATLKCTTGIDDVKLTEENKATFYNTVTFGSEQNPVSGDVTRELAIDARGETKLSEAAGALYDLDNAGENHDSNATIKVSGNELYEYRVVKADGTVAAKGQYENGIVTFTGLEIGTSYTVETRIAASGGTLSGKWVEVDTYKTLTKDADILNDKFKTKIDANNATGAYETYRDSSADAKWDSVIDTLPATQERYAGVFDKFVEEQLDATKAQDDVEVYKNDDRLTGLTGALNDAMDTASGTAQDAINAAKVETPADLTLAQLITKSDAIFEAHETYDSDMETAFNTYRDGVAGIIGSMVTENDSERVQEKVTQQVEWIKAVKYTKTDLMKGTEATEDKAATNKVAVDKLFDFTVPVVAKTIAGSTVNEYYSLTAAVAAAAKDKSITEIQVVADTTEDVTVTAGSFKLVGIPDASGETGTASETSRKVTGTLTVKRGASVTFSDIEITGAAATDSVPAISGITVEYGATARFEGKVKTSVTNAGTIKQTGDLTSDSQITVTGSWKAFDTFGKADDKFLGANCFTTTDGEGHTLYGYINKGNNLAWYAEVEAATCNDIADGDTDNANWMLFGDLASAIAAVENAEGKTSVVEIRKEITLDEEITSSKDFTITGIIDNNAITLSEDGSFRFGGHVTMERFVVIGDAAKKPSVTITGDNGKVTLGGETKIAGNKNGNLCVKDASVITLGETLTSPVGVTIPDAEYNKPFGTAVTGADIDATSGKFTCDTDGELSGKVENGELVWQGATYHVTLNNNGATSCGELPTYTYGVGATLPEPAKTGYTFGGWYANEQLTGDVVTEIDKTESGDKTFWAKWTANQYTVTFDSNGGSECDAIKVTYDQLFGGTATKVTTGETTATIYSDPLPEPDKAGYTFAGWYSDSGLTEGKLISDETKVAITDDITLYAKWTKNTYKVAFDKNGGTGDAMTEQDFTYDADAQALTENTYTKIGYTFDGWAKTETGNVAYADKAAVTNLTAESGATVTLYAQWKANTYKVAFDKNGGEGTEMVEQDFTYDAEQKLNENTYTKEGYTFGGWAKTETGNVEYADKAEATNLSAENGATVTLYAKWLGDEITVSFESNGGSEFSNRKVTVGDAYGGTATVSGETTTYEHPLPKPEKSGYTFAGWFDTEECTGNPITEASTVTKTTEHTLYAKWTANTYTVTFNANDGTVTETTREVTFGQLFGGTATTETTEAGETTTYSKPLPTPTRNGYKFDGWYFDGSFADSTLVTDGTEVDTADNITLYAKWAVDENGWAVRINTKPKEEVIAPGKADEDGKMWYYFGSLSEAVAALPESKATAYTTDEAASAIRVEVLKDTEEAGNIVVENKSFLLTSADVQQSEQQDEQQVTKTVTYTHSNHMFMLYDSKIVVEDLTIAGDSTAETGNKVIFNLCDNGSETLSSTYSAVTLGDGAVLRDYYSGGQYGAAAYIGDVGSFTIKGTARIDNCGSTSTDVSAALFVHKGELNMEGGTISNCNSTKGGAGNGGAVYVDLGRFSMTGGTITGNKAANGAAIYAPEDNEHSKRGSVSITGGTITGNTSGSYVNNVWQSGYDVYDVFVDNSADLGISGEDTKINGTVKAFHAEIRGATETTGPQFSEDPVKFDMYTSCYETNHIVIANGSGSTVPDKQYDAEKGTFKDTQVEIEAGYTYRVVTGPTVATLEFSIDGAEGTVPAEIIAVYNNPVTLPSEDGLTKDGYQFNGWREGSGDPSKDTYNNRSTKHCDTITLTADWSIKTYTVQWMDGEKLLEIDTDVAGDYGAETVKKPGVAYNTEPSYSGTMPDTKTEDGHTYLFTGWSPTITAVTEDVTYTAQYEVCVARIESTYYTSLQEAITDAADNGTVTLLEDVDGGGVTVDKAITINLSDERTAEDGSTQTVPHTLSIGNNQTLTISNGATIENGTVTGVERSTQPVFTVTEGKLLLKNLTISDVNILASTGAAVEIQSGTYELKKWGSAAIIISDVSSYSINPETAVDGNKPTISKKQLDNGQEIALTVVKETRGDATWYDVVYSGVVNHTKVETAAVETTTEQQTAAKTAIGEQVLEKVTTTKDLTDLVHAMDPTEKTTFSQQIAREKVEAKTGTKLAESAKVNVFTESFLTVTPVDYKLNQSVAPVGGRPATANKMKLDIKPEYIVYYSTAESLDAAKADDNHEQTDKAEIANTIGQEIPVSVPLPADFMKGFDEERDQFAIHHFKDGEEVCTYTCNDTNPLRQVTLTKDGDGQWTANFTTTDGFSEFELERIQIGHNDTVSLSLEGNIGVNFHLDLDSYTRVKKVVLTYYNPEFQYSPEPIEETYEENDFAGHRDKDGVRYCFTTRAASGQMADEITIKIYVDGDKDGKADAEPYVDYHYTVRKVAEQLMANENRSQEERTLAKALLAYGGYAQTYFNYNVDDLAYEVSKDAAGKPLFELSELELDKVSAGDLTSYLYDWKSTKGDGLKPVSMLLNCENTTKAVYKFALPEGKTAADYTATVAYKETDRQKYNGEISVTWEQEGNRMVVSVCNIAAALLNDNFVITLCDEDGLAGTFVGSALNYPRSVLTNEAARDKSLVDFVKAFYKYNQSAEKFFGA